MQIKKGILSDALKGTVQNVDLDKLSDVIGSQRSKVGEGRYQLLISNPMARNSRRIARDIRKYRINLFYFHNAIHPAQFTL